MGDMVEGVVLEPCEEWSAGRGEVGGYTATEGPWDPIIYYTVGRDTPAKEEAGASLTTPNYAALINVYKAS
jgi:hypothetical protein